MVAILHEGTAKKTADNELLKLLLESLELDETQVKFFGMGSKNNFFKKEDNEKYEVLLTEVKEENISKILFVVDADNQTNDNVYGGYQNTEQHLKRIINELGLDDIADIYITCDPTTKCGYLESLILSSIPVNQKKCIEDFLNCSEFKSKDNHKKILHQIYKSAYPNAPFDFNHSNFNDLKIKLQELFTV